MAQFDVFRLPGGELVVDVQADAIGIQQTRVVIPLLTTDDELSENPRLAPAMTIKGEIRLCAVPLIGVVAGSDIKHPIASLAEERLKIQAALDLLLTGF